MRSVFWLLALVALAAANAWEEPWVEEEDLAEYEDSKDDEAAEAEPRSRTRREAYVEDPYEEHIRVKRRCCDEEPYEIYRVRRSPEYSRVPRQIHQYEVFESTDDDNSASMQSPPFEEMLAASAEHYHRVYAAPGVPVSTGNSKNSASASYDVSDASKIRNSYPSNTQFAPVYVNHNAPLQRTPAPSASPVTYHATYKPLQNVSSNHAFVPVQNVLPVQRNPGVVSQNAYAPVQFIGPSNVGYVPLAGSKAQPSAVPVAVVSEPTDAVFKLAEDRDLHHAAAHHNHKQHHHHKHHHGHHGHTAGGGHSKHAHHHGAHGGKSIKGFNTKQHTDKGSHGHKIDEHHKKEYEEASGKKNKHHDKAGHKGGHEEEAHGQRGAHFDEKKGHKKGHKTKGYHNKYHKDEFHKEHKFYDDFHKSGEHHRYGKFHAKHASDESGKKKAHHVNAGHDFVERGKKGYSNKGHLDADKKGYKGKQGHEEHHEHHKTHGKKGGSEGGKEWGYSKKN